MYLDKNSGARWLIKTENKILGPYSFDQIIDLIRKKQVSLVDEIRDPETRWLYVRENPEFKNIVEEIRKQVELIDEKTKTSQTASKISNEIIQKTKTDFNLLDANESDSKDVEVVNEVIELPVENPTYASEPDSAPIKKSYGVKTDRFVEKKLKEHTKKAMIMLTVVGISAFATYFGYSFFQKRENLRLEEYQIQQIKTYKRITAYRKATDIFFQLPDAIQKKMLPELLEFYPLLESAGAASIEDINALSAKSILTSEQKAQVELIYFISSISKNNFPDAQEHLVKAAAYQSDLLLVKENEALLSLMKGEYKEAFNIYNNILKQEENGRYLFGLSVSYFGMTNLEKNLHAKEVLSRLERYTSVYYDYKKELLLAQLALASELNDTVLYKVTKTQYFNTPCGLSAEYIKPLLLASTGYKWQDLSGIHVIVQKNMSDDELILFQLHNYLELNQMSAAAEFNNNNMSRVSSPAIKAQMNLLILDAQKRNNEVVALEKSSKLDMKSELNHFLLAKNKIDLNGGDNISSHLDFFDSRQLVFYKDWLQLQKLLKNNSTDELKNFVANHFITVTNFNPILLAKSLIN